MLSSEYMHYADLIVVAEEFARHASRSEQTVSNWIFGHARMFKRLRSGMGCSVHNYAKGMQWFSDNWPAELPWPSDVPRPTKSPIPDQIVEESAS